MNTKANNKNSKTNKQVIAKRGRPSASINFPNEFTINLMAARYRKLTRATITKKARELVASGKYKISEHIQKKNNKIVRGHPSYRYIITGKGAPKTKVAPQEPIAA